jgi:lactate dehydrogenase-like 2-hydroxyacid dehydrogenase
MSARPVVVLTRKLPDEVERVAAERFEVRRNVDDHQFSIAEMITASAEADGIICTLGDPLRGDVWKNGKWRARILANFGAGTDHIDLAAAEAAGIVVTNTPGALTEATADLAMALILMATRRLGEGEREVRARKWTGWRPTHLLGNSIQGKTLGVVGFGRIGQATARRAHFGFGMKVVYTRRQSMVSPGAQDRFEATAMELDELLQVSDVISLHTPATPETMGMIDARRIGLMKPGSYLINTARGSVVDEEALIAALRSGQIAAAGLDVYPKEPTVAPALLALPNVVTLPHLGSATIETRTAMGLRAVDNLSAHFGNRPLLDPVG